MVRRKEKVYDEIVWEPYGVGQERNQKQRVVHRVCIHMLWQDSGNDKAHSVCGLSCLRYAHNRLSALKTSDDWELTYLSSIRTIELPCEWECSKTDRKQWRLRQFRVQICGFYNRASGKRWACYRPFGVGNKQMRVIYGAMNVVAISPQKCELKWFLVRTHKMAEPKCVRILGPYCRDIGDCKDISAVQHDIAL